ncbi:NADAR domain-containing protein [Tessaracoccus lubricantis]|uniref:NADAR domain-containing protein n=1 Tax=Tessaracoccus lubricantis TaxID=545543 RepID=A0ABP9FEW5_9ACTN
MVLLEPLSVADLRASVSAGVRPHYLLFWGHTPDVPGQLDRGCLSENYQADFEADGEVFRTAQHYVTWRKAQLFGDHHAAQRVLRAEAPTKARAIGRSVRPFNDEVWKRHRFEIAVAANLAKFGAHPHLLQYLKSTGSKILVEASPIDRVWGIGLSSDDPAAREPARWPGLNIQGFALMEARRQLS